MKQLIDRQEEDMATIPITSREEQLEFNISGLDNLSDENYTAPLIHTQNYNYNLYAQKELEQLPNQQIVVVDDFYLFSRFDEPVAFDFLDEDNQLSDIILNGDRYIYWDEVEQARVLVYFQSIEHPVFYNSNAILLIHLNSEGHITQYEQTQLRVVGGADEERSLIKQYDAVYRLYHHLNTLRTGDTITNASLGYHNLVSLPNGEQLLNPTWNIQVNNSQHHFVNAIEGHNYPQNDQFFLENIITLIDLLESEHDDNLKFYHLEDEREDLLSKITQTLLGVHQNIVEVDKE